MPHIILVVIQNASDNMDNHLMAIPADHIVTVYIPVTVDEVIHEAMIEFAAVNDIPEIRFFSLKRAMQKVHSLHPVQQ